VLALLAACLAMAQIGEEFVVRPGSPHEASGGLVFSLEAGSHKHGEGGLATGHWVLRFERGREKGLLPFTASAPEDFYGEGYAFGALFRLMGEAPGGGIKMLLRPRTATPARATRHALGCREILQHHQGKFALPEGVSLAGGASVREGTGACIFSPTDGSAVVVVGMYSLEVLFVGAKDGPPRSGPILK
jgi:hypothetical protein